MALLYVTGLSGTGKSAILGELRAQGCASHLCAFGPQVGRTRWSQLSPCGLRKRVPAKRVQPLVDPPGKPDPGRADAFPSGVRDAT